MFSDEGRTTKKFLRAEGKGPLPPPPLLGSGKITKCIYLSIRRAQVKKTKNKSIIYNLTMVNVNHR